MIQRSPFWLACLFVAVPGQAQVSPDVAAPPASVPQASATPTPTATPAPRPTPAPRSPTAPAPQASPSPRPAAARPPAEASERAYDRGPRAPRPSTAQETRPAERARVILPGPAPLPTFSVRDDTAPPALPPGVATEQGQVGSEKGWTAEWLIALSVAVLLVLGLLLWRWRVGALREAALVNTRVPTGPMPPPAPPAAGSAARFWTPAAPARAAVVDLQEPADVPRARIVVSLVARRAGLNLLSATAEVEVEVRNEGDGRTDAVGVALHLLGASAEQDRALGELFAAPPSRPVEPPFALEPGDARTVRATLALSRAAIVPIAAADRPMFVPVVAVDVRYDLPDGAQGQTAAAYMIGALRGDSDKLAPFWLDAAPRTLDEVAARPHALAISS